MAQTATWDGKDRVLRGCKVSHFGDPNDTSDSGVGAWGFDYRQRPDFPGIALPSATIIALGLKQYHPIKVYDPSTHKNLTCFLIDKGPAARLHRDADLLIYPWEYLGYASSGPTDPGTVMLDLRIILPENGPA